MQYLRIHAKAATGEFLLAGNRFAARFDDHDG